MRAHERKLKEERQSEANNTKENQEKEAKKKKKDKKSKESRVTERGVSPRRGSAPMQQLFARRKRRGKRATSIREFVTLVEPVQEHQQPIRLSP